MFDGIYKLLKLLLPFLKELILGDSDVKETIQRNKIVAFLIMCFILLFMLFVYNYDQVVQTRQDNSDLAQNNAVLKASVESNKLYMRVLQEDLITSRKRANDCLQNDSGSGTASVEMLGLKQALSQVLADNQQLRNELLTRPKVKLHLKGDKP